MKRKVIQIANSTHLVSLPRKWALRNSIVKGQEIEVREDGDQIIISTEKKDIPKKITLDFNKFNERVVRWTLSSAHKSGYDEIEVIFSDIGAVKVIEDMITNLLVGFVVIEQSENRCLLRAITKIDKGEYSATLKRAFLIVITMGRSMLKQMETDRLETLKNLITLEHTNNQLTNFCERIINKFGSEDGKNPGSSYIIPWNLEKICDSYKYICLYLGDQSNMKIGKKTLSLFKKVNEYFEGYFTIFNNYSSTRLNRLAEERLELIGEISKISLKCNRKDIPLLIYIHDILEKTTDFSASIVSLHLP